MSGLDFFNMLLNIKGARWIDWFNNKSIKNWGGTGGMDKSLVSGFSLFFGSIELY